MGGSPLNSCCCVCTIKTGTKVILWFSLIGTIVLLFMCIGTIIRYDKHVASPPLQTAHMMNLWNITIYIVMLIAVILAIHGVKKGHHSCLVPFLISVWVHFIVEVVVVVYRSSILSSYLGNFATFLPLICFISFLLEFYFWLVVYSHYRDLKKPQTAPSPV